MFQLQSSIGARCGSSPSSAGGIPGRVEWRERVDMGGVYLNAAVDAAGVADGGSAAVGVPLPVRSGLINRATGRSAMWLTPRAWLVQCRVEDELELAARVNAAFPDKRLHAALFTDYLYWLELRGEGVEELLQQGGIVSLERDGLAIGHAKRTLVANIPAVIICERKFEWLVAIERSRSRYFVDWVSSLLEV